MGRKPTERRSRRASLAPRRLAPAGGRVLHPTATSAAERPAVPGIPEHPALQAGTQCKSVLLIGDSLMTPVSNVQDVLQQSGRCSDVVNAAVNGTAPAGNLQGVDWSTRLQGLVDQLHPQIVVIQFVGNGFDGTNDAGLVGAAASRNRQPRRHRQGERGPVRCHRTRRAERGPQPRGHERVHLVGVERVHPGRDEDRPQSLPRARVPVARSPSPFPRG